MIFFNELSDKAWPLEKKIKYGIGVCDNIKNPSRRLRPNAYTTMVKSGEKWVAESMSYRDGFLID